MAQLEQSQVFQAMGQSPNARLLHSAELGDGLAAALWRNSHDTRDYQAPTHHTLSCYLTGGTGTFRRERPQSKGAPDKLCILPAGHQSAWVINGEIHLAHLYVSQEQFALGAVSLLDREPRELQLRESTFLDDPQQAQRFRQLSQLNWHEPAERLLSSSLAHALLDHALLSQVGRRDGLRLTGGLAPVQRRRLREFIDSHLADPLSLGQLASLCALSEYHFARMFSLSFGVPPHRYLLTRRLAHAQELLRHSARPLGEIALACGFASASHFNNRFRQAFGATPGQYRHSLAH
ncbi:AraC family transcriptional regulator [Pseudomonas sp. UBA2684]|uniref:AraC family transcriptional regulator n=1 Tax=Pseudomonas sp. UBA2684 TaxID=1947311 RepID=UPI000E868A84|nr:AraC family transcriptional regulator [Pseudomonas sp. UBA2684]HBX55637.1 AraC family transcriptional regulator [Pseudomonas sp.]|tara:strand:- start:2482 stop:3357 length:876 start_codon:yes stop_codon:yes gene_type:complete